MIMSPDPSNFSPVLLAIQLLTLIGGCVVTLAFEFGIAYAFYFFLTLPMRRNERTRLFLDMLELGLKDGQTPEGAIMSAASSEDRAMGVRFHIMAEYLQTGERLSAALDRVPRLLPPQVDAMLHAGERVGDIRKVLPACRKLVEDGLSQVRGAINYVILLAFAISPAAVALQLTLNVTIIPKIHEVFSSALADGQLPGFTELVINSSGYILLGQVLIIAFIWLLLIFYLGGPRLYGWSKKLFGGLPDWINFHTPWRRKRLLRDFSAMLAVLLDANMPEGDAVGLAAECTANSIVLRRSWKVQNQLGNGVKLPEALGALDDSGELQWRFTNALRRGHGFLGALNGWHEALDSKAFQQEQTAAQLTTTALVLFNGVLVGSIVIGMFLPIIALINQATLW